MRVALHNPQFLTDLKFHGYVRHLISNGLIKYIYISEPKVRGATWLLKRIVVNKDVFLKELISSGVELIFSVEELNRKADVLVDFSLMTRRLDHTIPAGLKKFSGLKFFHIGDYFWYHRGSEKSEALSRAGVDHLFGYARHDLHCAYFRSTFPQYSGKVWGLPFGYGDAFSMKTPIADRKGKIVAVGSVVHMRPLDQEALNYIEPATYFPDLAWMHPFRRDLALSGESLSEIMDSKLPMFPQQRDTQTDLVSAFNTYLGYVTCESVYNFPSAKTYEGMACGSALFCADLPCNQELGLLHGENCVMFTNRDLNCFQKRAREYLRERDFLETIALSGRDYVRSRFSHRAIAELISSIIERVYMTGSSCEALPFNEIPTAKSFG